EEFALNRYRGDADRAAAVYADVDRPLVAEDVAECVAWTVNPPPHVNVDRLIVRPLAQAAQHKLHRGPIFGEMSCPTQSPGGTSSSAWPVTTGCGTPFRTRRTRSCSTRRAASGCWAV